MDFSALHGPSLGDKKDYAAVDSIQEIKASRNGHMGAFTHLAT